MKVLKFGGTSVGTAENIKIIVSLLKKQSQRDPDLSVVVSAFGGVTDMLIRISELAQQQDNSYKTLSTELKERHYSTIDALFTAPDSLAVKAHVSSVLSELEKITHGVYLLRELSKRSLDMIMSFGERLSAYIIAKYSTSAGLAATFVDSRPLVITDDNFGAARVQFEQTIENIRLYYQEHSGIKIITGFIAASPEGVTTTLGRGGSDFTASIFGAALNADEIQIWTDVNGVMTSNPTKVPNAFPLKILSYEEAMELSHFGAKVLHPPTIQPALEQNISLKIMNTFQPDFPGTLIQKEPEANHFIIKGISSIQDISLLRIQGSGMIGVPGIASRIFSTLAREHINIILITQASSEHSICVAVVPEKVQAAKKMIEAEFDLEIRARMVDPVIVEKDLSILAIVGNNMRHTPGIAGRMFRTLGANGINVIAIAQGSSELNISVVIPKQDETRALNVLHQAFFYPRIKTVPLFIIGVTGLIGSTLLKQLYMHHDALLETSGIDFQVYGVADVDQMLFSETAMDLEQLPGKLKTTGEKTDMKAFIHHIKHLKRSCRIFVDCTASEDVSSHYEELFDACVSVTTPNKLANTGSWQRHQQLRQIAEKRNVHFLYETNVAAGLPVIDTIRSLVNTGDHIIKIEAILSGTLAYIFNTFNTATKFSDVVKTAKAKGYTEPDPRIDLQGTDVARKLLILIRELGIPMELTDLDVKQFIPEECLRADTVDDFLAELENHDGYFAGMVQQCKNNGTVLRHIASFENGKAIIELTEVDSGHPFFILSGSDNIVAFTTERYPNPLVIKGAGAGAEVTAAGVFADLIKVANFM